MTENKFIPGSATPNEVGSRTPKAHLVLVIVLIAVLVIGIVVYLIFFKEQTVPQEPMVGEKTIEEIVQDLTAPQNEEQVQVADEVIQSLTAPEPDESGQEETAEEISADQVSQDIIDSLTAPE